MFSVDGTRIDANSSNIKSLHHGRIQAMPAQLENDIAQLMEQAEGADASNVTDGLSLPGEIARRQNLKDKHGASILLNATALDMEGKRTRPVT